MKKCFLVTFLLFHLMWYVNTASAQTGFEPVIRVVANNMVSSSMTKGQVDKISNAMSKASDVYYSAKSSAVETQWLLSSTATQGTPQTKKTQKTAKSNRIRCILKKIETVFLDASLDSNRH